MLDRPDVNITIGNDFNVLLVCSSEPEHLLSVQRAHRTGCDHPAGANICRLGVSLFQCRKGSFLYIVFRDKGNVVLDDIVDGVQVFFDDGIHDV